MQDTAVTQSAKPKLTPGQEYIGVLFNVGQREDVRLIKQTAADLIDKLYELYDKHEARARAEHDRWIKEEWPNTEEGKQAKDNGQPSDQTNPKPPEYILDMFHLSHLMYEDITVAKWQIKLAQMMAVSAITRAPEVK